MLTLVSKSVINSLLTSKGGIAGCVLLSHTVFSTVQCDFVDPERTPSLFLRRAKQSFLHFKT